MNPQKIIVSQLKLFFTRNRAVWFGSIPVVFYCILSVVGNCRATPANQTDSLLITVQQASDGEKPEMFDRIAKNYYFKQDYLKAYEYFNKALKAAELVHDSLLMAKSNNNVAVVFDVTGNYDDAAASYKKALFYFMKLNDTAHMAAVLNNLGVIYEEMEDYRSALNYYRKALKMKKKANDMLSYAGTLNNMGIIFRNYFKEHDSALYYYKEAKRIYHDYGVKSKEMLCNVNIGTALLNSNNADSAMHYFTTAWNYFSKNNNASGMGNTLFLMGKVYQRQGDDNKALKNYRAALEIARKKQLLKLQKNILNNLTDVEAQLGDTAAAYIYMKQFQKINDALFGLTKSKLLKEHNNSIKIQEQARQVALLQKEEELNRLKYKRVRLIALIAGIVSFLILIIGLLFYKISKQKAEEDLNILKSQLVRSQLSPHFIFNTLMGIETILMQNRVEEAMNYIVDFARLVRYILENTKEALVSLAEELKAMEQYLKLEQMRFSERFTYKIITHLKTPPEAIDIPPMLIQPFLENAVVHAFPTLKERKGELKLTVYEKNNHIEITIEDNGIGREKAKEIRKKNKSLATQLIKSRIGLLIKRRISNISLKIEDLKDEKGAAAGTRVVFVIQKTDSYFPYIRQTKNQ